MYYTALDLDTAILDALSEVTPRLPRLASAYVETNVQPAIQGEVNRVIAPYPPQRVPWGNGFATPKSRKWYFANKVPKGSKGGHYQRTGDLAAAWVVRIDRRSQDEFIIIKNTEPYAGYVYGAGNSLSAFNQVPGHKLTGFGADFDSRFAQVTEFSVQQLFAMWNYLMDAILEGKLK